MRKRIPVKENVYDENGEIKEVIVDGKRYYPPTTSMSEFGCEVTMYRPILSEEEREAFDKGLLEMFRQIS